MPKMKNARRSNIQVTCDKEVILPPPPARLKELKTFALREKKMGSRKLPGYEGKVL